MCVLTKQGLGTSRYPRLFKNTLGYSFEKLRAGIRGTDSVDRDLAMATVESVGDLLSAVSDSLTERGMSTETYPGVDLVWRDLEYPMKALRSFFSMGRDDSVQRPESQAAAIFAWYVEEKVGELQTICREIDEDYNSDETA